MGFDWIPSKNYKRHFICLTCHKGFKRSSEEDMKNALPKDFASIMTAYYGADATQDIVEYLKAAHKKLKVVCPNCQGDMLQVHYNFEVPAQRDGKSWKKLKKELPIETDFNYGVYVQWHRSEILKITKNSPRYILMRQNLEKLERVSSTKEP